MYEYLEVLILLLSIPSGMLVAWLARDELVIGRRYFFSLILLSVLGVIVSKIFSYEMGILMFGFISIFSYISYMKSFDEKWIKNV